jgi:hypothetical protein
VEKKSLLLIFSSVAPQRTAYREVPSKMAAYLRTGSPLKAGEIARFESRTAVSQSSVTTNEPPLVPKMFSPFLTRSMVSQIQQNSTNPFMIEII